MVRQEPAEGHRHLTLPSSDLTALKGLSDSVLRGQWFFLSSGTALSTQYPEFRSVAAATFVFLVTFLIAYLSQIVFGRFLVVIAPTFDLFTIPKSDLICTNCKTVQLHADICSHCGGQLESARLWRWISDDEKA